MDSTAPLLQPYITGLSDYQLEQIEEHLSLLLRWNDRINLTSVRTREEVLTRHFGESLFAARKLLDAASQVAACDLGSGAGFPGIPLKIYAPHLELTLIESHNKKAVFLKELIRVLKLPATTIYEGRAEALVAEPAFAETQPEYGLVTMRAVEKFERTLPWAAKLVAPGGRLGLLLGSSQAQLAPKSLPEFHWLPAIDTPGSQNRVLLVGEKPSSLNHPGYEPRQ